MISGRVILGSTREIILPHINKTETLFERNRGLLGCKKLEKGHGLLIIPCNSVHTFFMKIPIDVVFLNRDKKIITVKKNMKPFRFTMSPTASSVLELMAGQANLLNLQKGDQLLWEVL